MAAKQPGDFKASELGLITAKASQMWADSRAERTPIHVEAAKAILENQTARFEEITNSDKDQTVRVTWLEDCALTTKPLEDSCDLDGVELNSNSKDFSLNIGQQTTYKVDAMVGRTNHFTTEETIARGFMNRINALDSYHAQNVLTQLKATAGANKYPAPFTYDQPNRNTNIEKKDYNLKMVANLVQQGILNEMQNPYFISDGILFPEYLNARLDGGNGNGKGDLARSEALNMYFDQVNFAKAGLSENLFMIDQSAVGLYTKAWNPTAPALFAGQVQKTIYSVPSNNLPGVFYDVEYTMTCETKTGKPHYYHIFKISTQGLFAVNPVACDDSSNGILSYIEVPNAVPPVVEE